jgi:hypothetical protein
MKVLYTWKDLLGDTLSLVQCDDGPHTCLHVREASKYPQNCSGWYHDKYRSVIDSDILQLIRKIEDLENNLLIFSSNSIGAQQEGR